MREDSVYRPLLSESGFWRVITTGFAVVLAAAACAPTAAPATATATPLVMVDVNLRVDFTLNGKHAPFFLGIKNGYYREAGINLKVLEGKGSLSTAQLVASKDDIFGFADANPVATVIAGGAPIRMVANFQQKSPIAALSFGTLANPKDFVGKTVGIAAVGAAVLSFNAFLARNNLKASDMKIVNLDGPALLPALIAGRIDIDIGNYNTEGAAAPIQAGKPVNAMILADWGVPALAHGLIVHKDTTDKQADLVRRFVAASVKSWQAAIDRPTAAVDAMMEPNPDLNRQIITNQFNLSLPLIHSANTTGQSLGKMADADWAATIELLKQYSTLKTDLPTSAFYTNEFLPQ